MWKYVKYYEWCCLILLKGLFQYRITNFCQYLPRRELFVFWKLNFTFSCSYKFFTGVPSFNLSFVACDKYLFYKKKKENILWIEKLLCSQFHISGYKLNKTPILKLYNPPELQMLKKFSIETQVLVMLQCLKETIYDNDQMLNRFVVWIPQHILLWISKV